LSADCDAIAEKWFLSLSTLTNQRDMRRRDHSRRRFSLNRQTIMTDLQMFPDVVFVAPATGYDAHGKPNQFGGEIAYPARIARKQRYVTGNASGELAVSRAQIWFAPDPLNAVTVNYGDRLRLPAGVLPTGDTTTTTILAIDSAPDEIGTEFLKVYL
jgi:hypothetical protein